MGEFEYMLPLYLVNASGRTTIYLARASRDRSVDRFGNAERPHVCLGGRSVTVQEVEHRVAARRRGGITRREVDDDGAIGGVAFEIAFEGTPVDGDAFDRAFGRRRFLRPPTHTRVRRPRR